MRALMLMMSCCAAGCTASSDSLWMADRLTVAEQPVAEYANTWWQWAYSMPPASSAVRDTSGEHCAANQDGDVPT